MVSYKYMVHAAELSNDSFSIDPCMVGSHLKGGQNKLRWKIILGRHDFFCVYTCKQMLSHLGGSESILPLKLAGSDINSGAFQADNYV